MALNQSSAVSVAVAMDADSHPEVAKPIAPELDVFEVTEQYLRDFVKAEVPRLIRRRSRAMLVEEMEVCLGRARVDLAVIADRLIGIEIKGPRDDVTRLPGQVLAYSRCFDRVILVVDEALAKKALPLVPDWWGIVIGGRCEGAFVPRFERRPRPNPQLDMDALLSLLWREEINSLTRDLLGIVTKPRATKRALRSELCERLDVDVLRQASLDKLRARSDWRSTPVHQVPCMA